MADLERVRGCLLGGAIGDALGYPIEFIDAAAIRAKYGARPPLHLDFASAGNALVSDDTQMTLFTAEGLIRARAGGADPIAEVAAALLRWYETQVGFAVQGGGERGGLVDEPRLRASRAPGNTCLSALSRLAQGVPRPSVARPPNDSKGCGAVMRVAPCGLVAATREEAWALARDTGVITHGHPSGYLSGAYFAALIWDLARGASVPDAMRAADPLLAAAPRHEEMSTLIARVRELAPDGPPSAAVIEKELGGGWVGEEALAIALLCALTYEPGKLRSVESALWCAAVHSGDSDSTAAIAGNLLGAQLGAAALPAEWVATVELRDLIEQLASELAADGSHPSP